MARAFQVPEFYRSPIVSAIKTARRAADPRKKDLSPSVLDFGPIRFKLARHFGFCYGVENAVEIAYRALDENPGKRIFLLSEMIHNPHVNEDLTGRGIRFLRTTNGKQLIPFSELTADDVVIIPAFGASLEVYRELEAHSVDVKSYDTTCPFVEKVWKRSEQIGDRKYSVVVHGKRHHEETRATFSHARRSAPVIVIRDLEEAQTLAAFILGERPTEEFHRTFRDRCSPGFDPAEDLQRIGVVNQTTMLASETVEISALLRDAMRKRFGAESLPEHFADTSDTLCYATNENQDATKALISEGANLALIVGGYNSSNTSHLVELCEEAMPTYFIKGPEEILSIDEVRHFDYPAKQVLTTRSWLPEHRPVEILLTAGASCPDMLLDRVIRKITGWVPDSRPAEEVISLFQSTLSV